MDPNHVEDVKRPSPDTESAPSPEPLTTRPRRFFWPALAGICLIGLVCRLVILREYLDENPMAQKPAIDAATYWAWAGRIADGQLTQDVPFFSAPLYPYLLGTLRALGGTLTTVYAVQGLMDLTTACLLGFVGRRRFGPGAGLLAAALFLALQEPAAFSLRVLSCSLHLLLVAIAWALLVAVQNKPTGPRCAAVGAALGVLCLSYPAAMLLVVAIGPWLFWQSRRHLGDALRAAIPVGAAALIIAPATFHNWRASGDLFLIQALSGVTLRLGNSSEAAGTYTAIPGISRTREYMLSDAARVYQEATGNPPGWRETDAYFRNQVYDAWRSNPAWAVKLAARKLYWFLTARNYGDIYQPTAEIAYGLADSLGRLAPLPTAWLIGPGLVGLALMLRHPVRYGPEWMLVTVPVLVVMVFWYSPRYRVPALPVLTVAAAWAVVRAVQRRARRRTSVAVAAALAMSIVLGIVNRAIGFDRLQLRSVAIALVDKGEFAQAEDILHRLLDRNPDSPSAIAALAYARQMQGSPARAYELYRRALDLEPDDTVTRALFGSLLVQLQRWDEALEELTTVVRATPDHFEAHYNLGVALCARREFARAREHLERALEFAPDDVRVVHGLGVLYARQRKLPEAAEYFRRALEIDPTHRKSQNDLQRVRQMMQQHEPPSGPTRTETGRGPRTPGKDLSRGQP